MRTILIHFLVGTAILISQVSFGAEYRTDNFIVNAPTAESAQQIGERAEYYRDALAVEWLGEELPGRWSKPCIIDVRIGQIGAGGSTTFAFDRGEVFGWRMRVQGSLERILDSVVPHEVNHTIFACHFRRPLPRWADEGAATLMEHESERRRQHLTMKQMFNTPRRISLRRLFSVTEYPMDSRNVIAMYAQGHSVTEYLVQQKDKPHFLSFLGQALQSNWDQSLQSHYGISSVESLEQRWVQWVTQKPPPKEIQIVAQADQKPVLYVLTAGDSCLPCYRFKQDVQAGHYNQYNVQWIDNSRDWDRVTRHVARPNHYIAPQYYVQGTDKVVYQQGRYDRPGLLQILGGLLREIGKLIYNPDAEPKIVSGTQPQLGQERTPPSEQETFDTEEEIEINWAGVEVGILVAEQDLGGKLGVAAGVGLTAISGPAERAVHELSNGKANLHIVSERTTEDWYNTIAVALGVRPTKFYVFVLADKQPLGLLKGIVASKVEAKIDPIFESLPPIEVIFNRTAPTQYQTIKVALESVPEAYSRAGEGFNLKAVVHEAVREASPILLQEAETRFAAKTDETVGKLLPEGKSEEILSGINKLHELRTGKDSEDRTWFQVIAALLAGLGGLLGWDKFRVFRRLAGDKGTAQLPEIKPGAKKES